MTRKTKPGKPAPVIDRLRSAFDELRQLEWQVRSAAADLRAEYHSRRYELIRARPAIIYSLGEEFRFDAELFGAGLAHHRHEGPVAKYSDPAAVYCGDLMEMDSGQSFRCMLPGDGDGRAWYARDLMNAAPDGAPLTKLGAYRDCSAGRHPNSTWSGCRTIYCSIEDPEDLALDINLIDRPGFEPLPWWQYIPVGFVLLEERSDNPDLCPDIRQSLDGRYEIVLGTRSYIGPQSYSPREIIARQPPKSIRFMRIEHYLPEGTGS